MSEQPAPEVPAEVVTEPAGVTELEAALATVDTHKYNVDVFNQVYDQLSKMIKGRKFTAVNWVILVPMAMELAETVPNLQGHEKRAIVVDLLIKLIGELDMSPEDRVIIMSVVRTSLPALIDTICDGALGKFAINVAEQIEEGARRCWAKCTQEPVHEKVVVRYVTRRKVVRHRK